jgi:hypothetical protein
VRTHRAQFYRKVPAFLISGDTGLESLRRVSTGGYVLLHKPVDPMTLRATIDRFRKTYAEPNRTRVSTTL